MVPVLVLIPTMTRIPSTPLRQERRTTWVILFQDIGFPAKLGSSCLDFRRQDQERKNWQARHWGRGPRGGKNTAERSEVIVSKSKPCHDRAHCPDRPRYCLFMADFSHPCSPPSSFPYSFPSSSLLSKSHVLPSPHPDLGIDSHITRKPNSALLLLSRIDCS